MSVLLILILALLLDAAFGEPEGIWQKCPHPAKLMGQAVQWFDDHLNRGTSRKAKGVLAMALLGLLAILTGKFIHLIPDFGLLELVLTAILIAHHDLVKHVRQVAFSLRRNLADGRASVAMIVGRDVKSLDANGVARGAIESAAENFSDAVVAPILWFLIFGLPGILFYKMVNTADSMIGYRSEKHADFGYGAAKLDDVVNWVPARLTALLICLTYRSRVAWEVVMRDADLHRSPNAGWPEAAMAGVLDLSLAGPRSYDGKMSVDPFVNEEGRKDLTPDDIEAAAAVLDRVWWVLVLGLAGLWLLTSVF